jgi:hypothetical protein
MVKGQQWLVHLSSVPHPGKRSLASQHSLLRMMPTDTFAWVSLLLDWIKVSYIYLYIIVYYLHIYMLCFIIYICI